MSITDQIIGTFQNHVSSAGSKVYYLSFIYTAHSGFSGFEIPGIALLKYNESII